MIAKIMIQNVIIGLALETAILTRTICFKIVGRVAMYVQQQQLTQQLQQQLKMSIAKIIIRTVIIGQTLDIAISTLIRLKIV